MVGQADRRRRGFVEDGPGGAPSAARRFSGAADRSVAALQSRDGADPYRARRGERYPVARNGGPDGQGATRSAYGRGSRRRPRALARRTGSARGGYQLPRHRQGIEAAETPVRRSARTQLPRPARITPTEAGTPGAVSIGNSVATAFPVASGPNCTPIVRLWCGCRINAPAPWVRLNGLRSRTHPRYR